MRLFGAIFPLMFATFVAAITLSSNDKPTLAEPQAQEKQAQEKQAQEKQAQEKQAQEKQAQEQAQEKQAQEQKQAKEREGDTKYRPVPRLSPLYAQLHAAFVKWKNEGSFGEDFKGAVNNPWLEAYFYATEFPKTAPLSPAQYRCQLIFVRTQEPPIEEGSFSSFEKAYHAGIRECLADLRQEWMATHEGTQ